jgi:UDP-N-acetylglucosamine 1-carboxyvinyltransferase
LLARCGEARVAMPGGDNIGSRKINMHLGGFEALGAEIDVRHGYIEARAPAGLSGNRMVLDFPSVGATENLITAAVRAKGTSVIENAAREPEITDLCAFLNRMGAQIVGAGSSTLEIDGAEELTPVDSELMGDRIEAGTLIMACGIAGGDIELTGVRPEHLELVTMKLGEMGMRVSPMPDGLWAQSSSRLRAVDVATLPFPGFATDFMPMVVALLAVADGTAIVTENVYDGRFQFVDELARMGADVRNEGRHAVVRGIDRLSGAPVQASDVRAGAALTIAGLAADGETTIHDCEHVDRGYPDLPAQLRALGADVTRI